jgi:N-sulfoglucosamine sulfohydrolase
LPAKLKEQGDPRISGQGDLFDNYPYAGAERGLYERFMKGEKLKTGWVNPSDYEPAPLDNGGKPR